MQDSHTLPGGQDRGLSYEIKAIGLLSLGMGLVGLDRFIINPLFPVMSKELGLNYQDLGLISAVLALCWGLSSVFAGRLSDLIGRKRVLMPSVVVFSLLVASSGLATGLMSLLLIRALMGLAEGAFVPASIVATAEASKPSRLGLNTGLQQMAAPLMGLGLGPVIAVGLLKVLPSWHWVFGVVAVPGLIVAWWMHRVLRDDAVAVRVAPADAAPATGTWTQVLRYRQVVLNTLLMFCTLSCLIVLSAFMPNYLTDHLKMGLDQMGGVLAALGLGGCLGMVAVPGLSDRLGRKPVMLLALAIEVVALVWLRQVGAEPVTLFGLLFVATFMNAGVVTIIVGPLTRRAVPDHLATTATGIVVGLGEVFGGAVSPALAGVVAQNFGIAYIVDISLAAVVVGGLLVMVGVRERRAQPWAEAIEAV